MEKINDEKVIRCIRVGKTLYACVDDIPSLYGEYGGIYINKEKPWFHGKKCTIKSQCVAHWDKPLTDEDIQLAISDGANESIVYWRESVACADENLYVKTDN